MCKQYREPLFSRMYRDLSGDGIELQVVYSRPSASHRQRKDDIDLPAEYAVRVPGHSLGEGRLLLQLPLAQIWRADLVIVEHALKHLINYPLAVLSTLRLKKVGIWLHGGTLRHPRVPLLRPLRLWSVYASDWIFAYTRQVAEAAVGLGVEASRVTALQNSIDLSGFRRALAAVSPGELAATRERLGIDADTHVALFCGSLYPGRGVDFLLASGDRIAQRDARFCMIVVGDGPLRAELERGAVARPWLRPVGSVFGDQRAIYFRLAQICLMPYLAGLGILDGMAAGLPYLVTGARATNPEIDYLIDGVTGMVTGDSVEQFADAAAGLFADPERLRAMSNAASVNSLEFSIEKMAQNFCGGIRACLAQPSHTEAALQITAR